jgi:hypothetical protein
MELRRSGYGVRRGEIVNFAGRYLGVVRQDEGVADADVIMSRYSREHFRKVPYDAAGSFFDWLDELYRVNQAERLRVRANFFARRPSDVAVLEAAATHVQGSPISTTGEEHSTDTLEVLVELPHAAAFKRLEPERLLALRVWGDQWYMAANEFMTSSSPDGRRLARIRAEAAILDYAK